MCVARKISLSLGCYVDNESMPLKILFISISKTELQHLYKSLLSSTKGLSIYFYVESSSSYKKAPDGEHRCHLHALLLIYIGYDYDGISFTMNYNVQSILDLQRCSAFMFCGLRKGQRDTILLYHIMIVLRKCCHPRFIIIACQLIVPFI